ncbi:hypothetical protein KAS79_01840 [Candidatus Parcubacteria bacterium]|nr:hypothetical protein [Candidatus Parcubacteria bacterium]
MLTIFSNPRPFQGPFDTIQRNAIKSWTLLRPKCEIILFEDEEGTTSRVAEEFGVQCRTDVACDEFGTPLLSDVFAKIRRTASNEIIAQVNADIILMSDFIKAIRDVKRLKASQPFFLTGRRWDLDIKEKINFNEIDWEKKLRQKIVKQGELHGFSGMDYWVFTRNLPINPPAFAVGRPGMDSWLIYKVRELKMPVIDATQVVDIIHQNHNYPQKKKHFFEIERKRNLKLAGGFSRLCTLRDADWILTPEGLKKPKFLRRIFSELSLFYPWRLFLLVKRKIQELLK